MKKSFDTIFITENLMCNRQVNFDGVTGSVRFSEDGERVGVKLEILNLRNDSFVQVSTMKWSTNSFEARMIKKSSEIGTHKRCGKS